MSKHRVVAKAQKKSRRNKQKANKTAMTRMFNRLGVAGDFIGNANLKQDEDGVMTADEVRERAYQRAKEARDGNRSS